MTSVEGTFVVSSLGTRRQPGVATTAQPGSTGCVRMRTHARTYVRSVRMHVRTNVICLRLRVRIVHNMHVRTHVRTVNTYVPTHAALFFPREN